MSPDPSGLAYANDQNPQTLNLYGYVGNNPLSYTDPSGLYACTANPAATNLIGRIAHAIHNAFCNPNDGDSPKGGQGTAGSLTSARGKVRDPMFFVTVKINPAEFGPNNGSELNNAINWGKNHPLNILAFKRAWPNYGPYDYKNQYANLSDVNIDGIPQVVHESYTDFGNLAYGEAARAASLPPFIYKRGPGFFHQRDVNESNGQGSIKATWNAFWTAMGPFPYGDQARDQHYISGDRSAYTGPDPQ